MVVGTAIYDDIRFPFTAHDMHFHYFDFLTVPQFL